LFCKIILNKLFAITNMITPRMISIISHRTRIWQLTKQIPVQWDFKTGKIKTAEKFPLHSWTIYAVYLSFHTSLYLFRTTKPIWTGESVNGLEVFAGIFVSTFFFLFSLASFNIVSRKQSNIQLVNSLLLLDCKLSSKCLFQFLQHGGLC